MKRDYAHVKKAPAHIKEPERVRAAAHRREPEDYERGPEPEPVPPRRSASGGRRGPNALQVILRDLLGAVLILAVYAFFSYGLPLLSQRGGPAVPGPVHTQEPAAPTAVPSPESSPEEAPEPTTEATPEPTPDTRTPWQIKFEDHFTDTVVQTDTSYTSPQVSIHIDTVTVGEGANQSVYHVADIYVASPENFCTYTANNELKYFSVQDAMEMDAAANALIAISGDFYAYQSSGFLVRNGEIYSREYAYCDICVMYNDGSIEIYPKNDYDIDEILERGVANVWNFGPSLLDENGHVRDSYKVSTAVSYPNPRSALGYYEPGHYCFVVVDGRQNGYSKGLTIPQLAQIFEDLGCVSAYNLDGGGSALMTFNHQRYSRQSNGADRKLGDILVIREIQEEGAEE